MEPPTSGKRARKKTVRLSESDSYGEPVKKKSKLKPESVDVPAKRGKGKNQTSGSKVKSKTEKGSTSRRGKDGKFVVSLNLGLLESSEKQGGSSNGVSSSRSESVGGQTAPARKAFPMKFKNPDFSFSYLAGNKKKTWKNLKQIIAAERALGLGPNDHTYSSIDAPPSLKPPKKYSDLSGYMAKYTDPLTGMFFSTSQEFQLIRTLPSNVVKGYLALRGKFTIT